MGECIALHRMALAEPILGALAGLKGGRYRRGRVTRGKGPMGATQVDYTDLDAVRRAKDRDARILMMASRLDGVSMEL